eukprot:182765-Prymnesium_polylepis.2
MTSGTRYASRNGQRGQLQRVAVGDCAAIRVVAGRVPIYFGVRLYTAMPPHGPINRVWVRVSITWRTPSTR